jgi:PAS domain S-box-containing protein
MLRSAAVAAAFATLYFLTAKLTGWLIGDPAVLWPASGVYLGVMLVAPRQMWSVLACAAGVGSFLTYLHGGASVELSIAFAVPSSAEGLLAALLVERIAGGRFRLAGGRDVFALVVGGAIVANGLVALSAAAVAAQAFDASFTDSWLRWWSADALGMLAVVPIVTVAVAARERERLHDDLGRSKVELARRIARLTAELAARSAEVHDGTRRRERLAADLRDLQAAGERTERELAEARTELARAADENGALEEELSRATSENGAVEEELSRAASQTRALEEALSRAGRQNGALEEELSRARTACGALQREIDRRQAEQARIGDELARAEADRRRAAEELAASRRDDVRSELEQSERAHAQTEQALERTRALLLEERARLERSLDEITATLARTEAERRLLADHATELIARYDERGTCLYASPASRRLLGYEPEELVARAGAELLHPEDRHLLARARAARSETIFQARLRHKAGDYIWVEVLLRPVLTHDGDRPVAITTTIRAISRDRDLAAA